MFFKGQKVYYYLDFDGTSMSSPIVEEENRSGKPRTGEGK